MSETTVLLDTPIGSRMYGLSHEGSDYDTYRVVSELSGRRKNKTKHSIKGVADVFTVDMKTFMYHAHTAAPQALEAMFSPVATVDALTGYRNGFRVSLSEMHLSYRERISIESRNGMKQRRHALRWALNFREAIERDGVFNPVLSEKDAEWVKENASSENFCEALKSVFPYEIILDEDHIKNNIRQESAN